VLNGALFRYLDSAKRSHTAVENDFYVYNIISNEWHLIAKDVALLGGPRLVFDHQVSSIMYFATISI